MRLQHHRLPNVFPVLSARIALIVKCHHYNARSQQKQRNRYKRLKAISDWRINNKTRKENSSEDRTERRLLSNQTRERHHEVGDEPPMQRLRLENPASAIRWSKTDESGHWSPITAPEAEEMWVETDQNPHKGEDLLMLIERREVQLFWLQRHILHTLSWCIGVCAACHTKVTNGYFLSSESPPILRQY